MMTGTDGIISLQEANETCAELSGPANNTWLIRSQNFLLWCCDFSNNVEEVTGQIINKYAPAKKRLTLQAATGRRLSRNNSRPCRPHK